VIVGTYSTSVPRRQLSQVAAGHLEHPTSLTLTGHARGATWLNYKWLSPVMFGESQEAPRGNNGGEAACHVALYRHRVKPDGIGRTGIFELSTSDLSIKIKDWQDPTGLINN